MPGLSRGMTSVVKCARCFQTSAATTSRSRGRCARVLLGISRPQTSEGAGKAGCPLHPQPPVQQKSTGVEATGAPEHPAFPAQWFYGLFRALPGDRACLPPSPADCSANLTPASGRQDHTTSPSAWVPFVSDTATSTASHPAFVTIAKRPSDRDGMCESIKLFLPNGEAKYFSRQGWTANSQNSPTGKSPRAPCIFELKASRSTD